MDEPKKSEFTFTAVSKMVLTSAQHSGCHSFSRRYRDKEPHGPRGQNVMRERSMYFDEVVLSDGFFAGQNKVNCAAPFSYGRKVVYGTDDGVYISDLREVGREPVKVLTLLEVSQVDVLEEYQLLIVLSGTCSLFFLPLRFLVFRLATI